MPALTNDRHERFAQEYLKDLNATAAYKRAGYKATGNGAEVSACRLLARPEVAARVAELQAERAERVKVEADDVLRELLIVGLSNVRDYVIDDDGQVDVSADARPGAIRAVQSIKRRRRVESRLGGEEVETVETDIRLWNKNTALQDLGKHLGLYTERIDVTTKGDPINTPVPPPPR